MTTLDPAAVRAWLAAPTGPCAHWCGDHQAYCGATDDVRLYSVGRRCPNHTPAALAGLAEAPNRSHARCAGCRKVMHPAAAAGHDGTPDVYAEHPGCEPGGHVERRAWTCTTSQERRAA